MDKDVPYETFQFIDTSDTNPDMNQLLVLQEDGTLLSVNRDIQYITQVRDVKDGDGQTCTVFDVSSQQFYVDVENSSNLLVPDQFAIHHPEGNIYSNSFLIQPENSAATTEPMETESSVPTTQAQQSESEATNTSKPANNFTEITLTDAQYHLLEQKGWVLLEFSERIFVLDTLGLHDITTDENLIQKLKSELEDNTNQLTEPGQVKKENITCPDENIKDEAFEVAPPLVEKSEPTESGTVSENVPIGGNSVKEPTSDHSVTVNHEAQIENPSIDLQQNDGMDKKCDSIKIKTKYTFSDIPDKIFLGKTVNGKKLYAKVTKSKHKEIMNMKMAMSKNICEKDTNVDSIDDVRFINMIQDYIREHPSKIKISNVIAADSVVTQLMRMLHIKETFMENYVIVTKTVIIVTADGKEKTRRKPSTIIGEVKSSDDTHGKFVHTPYMLHNIVASQEPSNIEESSQQSEAVYKIKQEFVEFVHVHITETKVPGKPSSQAINVCNRKVSLDVIRDAKKRHPKPIYACGGCAAVFKSQSTMTDHLENHCPGAEDPADDALTIDTDQLHEQPDMYYMLDTGKEKWYSCMQCEAKFLKLFNCKKHIKSHLKPTKKNTDIDGESNSEIKEYKCKMCSSKYFHASSLSKHIVKRHIQIHTNKKP